MSKPALLDGLLTYGSFPLVFGSVMGLALHGVSHGWPPAILLFGLTGAVVLVLLVLERVHPHEASWQHSRGDLRTDILHNLVNLWIPKIYELSFLGGSVAAGAWLSARLSVPLWPRSWPLLGQLLLALIIGELGTYWIHRAMHENPFLWRFHAAHHSASRLYWLNAGRFHPLDLLAQQILSLTPLALLGAGTEILVLHTVFTAVHGLFQHCNVRLRIGPLNWVFSMAELHRWHHSKRIDEANHNYGANLIGWDLVFGSRFAPKDRRPPEDIGIGNLPDFPSGYWAQLLSPFQWKAIERANRGAARSCGQPGDS